MQKPADACAMCIVHAKMQKPIHSRCKCALKSMKQKYSSSACVQRLSPTETTDRYRISLFWSVKVFDCLTGDSRTWLLGSTWLSCFFIKEAKQLLPRPEQGDCHTPDSWHMGTVHWYIHRSFLFFYGHLHWLTTQCNTKYNAMLAQHTRLHKKHIFLISK